MDRIRLLGVPIDRVTASEAIGRILDALRDGRGGWVVTPNLDHLRRLVRDPEFAVLCENADLRLADGMPLVWASRLQRTPLPQRVAGSDLIWSLSQAAAREGRSVYLLGGNPGAAERAAQILVERFPGLRIAGICCPEFGFDRDSSRREAVLAEVTSARPDLVYVALGSPKQERMIRDLRPLVPGAWCLGLGISFSFVTGEVRRAPLWMQRLGLEWVHRLIQEPRRLGRRYLLEGLPFGARLLAASAWRGLTGTGGGPGRDGVQKRPI